MTQIPILSADQIVGRVDLTDEFLNRLTLLAITNDEKIELGYEIRITDKGPLLQSLSFIYSPAISITEDITNTAEDSLSEHTLLGPPVSANLFETKRQEHLEVDSSLLKDINVNAGEHHPYWCKCQRVCGGDQ